MIAFLSFWSYPQKQVVLWKSIFFLWKSTAKKPCIETTPTLPLNTFTPLHSIHIRYCLLCPFGNPMIINGGAILPVKLSLDEQALIEAHPEVTVFNEFDWQCFYSVPSGVPQDQPDEPVVWAVWNSLQVYKRVHMGWTCTDVLSSWNCSIALPQFHPWASRNGLVFNSLRAQPNVLAIRNDSIETNDLNDLEGKIIVLSEGWSSIVFIQEYYPQIHIIEVENSSQALEYIDQGKVSATVEQDEITAYFIKKFEFQGLKLSQWIDNDA